MNTEFDGENLNNSGDVYSSTNMGAFISKYKRTSTEMENSKVQKETAGRKNAVNEVNAIGHPTKQPLRRSERIKARKLLLATRKTQANKLVKLRIKNRCNNNNKGKKAKAKRNTKPISNTNKNNNKAKEIKRVSEFASHEIMKAVQKAVSKTLNKNKFFSNYQKLADKLLLFDTLTKHQSKNAKKDLINCISLSNKTDDDKRSFNKSHSTLSGLHQPVGHVSKSSASSVLPTARAKRLRKTNKKLLPKMKNKKNANKCSNGFSIQNENTRFLCKCKDHIDTVTRKRRNRNTRKLKKQGETKCRQNLLNNRRNLKTNLLINKSSYKRYNNVDNSINNYCNNNNNNSNNLTYDSSKTKRNLNSEEYLKFKRNLRKSMKIGCSLNYLNHMFKNSRNRVVANDKKLNLQTIRHQKLLRSLKDYLNNKMKEPRSFHNIDKSTDPNNCPCYWVKHGTWR